jgi:hypothetical protein
VAFNQSWGDGQYLNVNERDCITSTMIVNGEVGQSDIATDGVGYSEIATDAVRSDEIRAGAVGASELAERSVDDVHMSFVRWGEWTAFYSAVIFQAAGEYRVRLVPNSNHIYIDNLSARNIYVNYASHKDATTSAIDRVRVGVGTTFSFDVEWHADISINIEGPQPGPASAWFFQGTCSGGGPGGATILGYYTYFNSTPLGFQGGDEPIQRMP